MRPYWPWSPPTRGRGSKHQPSNRRRPRSGRPPPGGVDRNKSLLAPAAPKRKSPPTRGRGSKRAIPDDVIAALPVAPHPGAWIETAHGLAVDQRQRGRPPPGGVDRNRTPGAKCPRRWMSPPTRGRGSKRRDDRLVAHRKAVAPHPGAWIETAGRQHRGAGPRRRPPPGGVDRNTFELLTLRPKRRVAPHPGAWIETCGS